MKQKMKFNVDGMHCTSCARLIDDVLREFDGVSNVMVSHKEGVAEVEFDNSKIKPDRIKSAIEGQGYKIRR